MFIRSTMNNTVTYNTNEHSIEIKPQTITYVDDSIVTAQALIDCYGQRISIISEELVKEIMEGTKATTGDEQVNAFLNGEVDEVPEGTTEITEEEAKKLAEEQAAKEAEEAKKLAEEQAAKEAEEQAAKEAEEAKKLAEDLNKKPAKASQTKNAKTGKGNK